MLRVLQLIDSDADFQTQTAAAQLGRGLGPGFEIERVAIPSNYAALAPAVLKLRRNQRADDRLIHAFGRHALAEAVLVGKRIIYTPNEFPSRRTIRWLRSASEYRDLHIVCPTDTMRRELVQGGVAIARCHLIRPGVDFAKVKRRRDDALRSALGFSPDDYVILAAGESDRAAAHHLAAWSVSILNVLDLRYKLLLWGRGPLADRAMRFANRVRLGELSAFA